MLQIVHKTFASKIKSMEELKSPNKNNCTSWILRKKGFTHLTGVCSNYLQQGEKAGKTAKKFRVAFTCYASEEYLWI